MPSGVWLTPVTFGAAGILCRVWYIRPADTGKLPIHSAQNFIHHFNNGHFHTKGLEESGKLHADYSSAYNDQRTGHFLVVECITVSPVVYFLNAGNGRYECFTSGTDQKMIASIIFSPQRTVCGSTMQASP